METELGKMADIDKSENSLIIQLADNALLEITINIILGMEFQERNNHLRFESEVSISKLCRDWHRKRIGRL